MNTRARQEERVPCSRDSEAEYGAHPRTPIAVKKAQCIQKIILKAKTVKEGTESLNYEEKSPVSKMMISPNLGQQQKRRWAMANIVSNVLFHNSPEARGVFDDLPPESIDSYNDLREAFLKNYLQQKKCIRDPIVLHNIKRRDGQSIEDFIQRWPRLFFKGQEAASNQERKKVPPAWRHQEGGHRQNFKKGGGFRSQHKQEKRPEEILALEKRKFKTPPPMTTPVEKQNANKFCEFHEGSGA
ncbi:hypothetical protein Tco_0260160 [Tanacetum coccineum]